MIKKILKKINSIFLAATLLIVCGVPVGAYKNSVVPSSPDSKIGNQIGDPYIMKYNGVYYLYAVSYSITYCWTSRDMVNWEFYGDVMAGKPADNPAYDNLYAPEVYYIDGKFYMYGSPMGLGHYFYESDSPTGPFTVITEKLDENYIDGTIFVDGDNTIYFLCGDFNGVRVKKMSNPTDYSGAYYKYNAGIANTSPEMKWTEGPTMFKRKGVYYLTYTGNQVWEKNYRVEYAYSHNLEDNFTEENDNVILLNTEGDDHVGLGHNGIVVGPDLDTYYIVYHNSYNIKYSDDKDASFSRRINMDKITWNGDKLCVQGPTTHEIDNPDMPDFYDYFDNSALSNWTKSGTVSVNNGFATLGAGSKLLSNTATADIFTAEYNMREASGTSFVTFGYVDGANYGRAYIDKNSKEFVMQKFVNGAAQWTKTSALASGFDYTALHSIVIKQDADGIYGLVDGVERITHTDRVSGGKIGYFAAQNYAVECAFTAFGGKAYGSADYETVKPVPSKIPAVQANNIKDNFTVCDASGAEFGNAVSVSKHQTLEYKINARQSGTYTVDLKLNRMAEDMTVAITIDGKIVKSVTIPADGNLTNGYNTYSVRGVNLSAGKQTLGVFVANGSGELYEVNVFSDSTVSAYTDAANSTAAWTVYETAPQFSNGKIVYGDSSTFGKATVGNSGCGDYSIESDITLNAGESAGFLVRATCVLTGLRTRPYLCDPYFHRGYYVGISDGKIILEKHKITEYTILKMVDCNVQSGKSARLKVSAVGNVITVYLDGVQVLRYADKNDPYTLGSVGVRSFYANSVFDNINISPETGLAENTTPEFVTVSDHTQKTEVDPARFSGNGFINGFFECVESPDSIAGKKLVVTTDARGTYKHSNAFLNTLVSANVDVPSGKYTFKVDLKGRLANDTYIFVKDSSGKQYQLMLTGSDIFENKETVKIKDVVLSGGNVEIKIQNWASSPKNYTRMEFSDMVFIPEQTTIYDMSIEVPNEKFAASSNLSVYYGGAKSNSRACIKGTTSGTAISTGTIDVPNGTYSLRYYVKNTGGQKSAKFMANVGGKEYYHNLAGVVTDEWTLKTIDNIKVTNNALTVMMWYSNSSADALVQIDGIELLREALSGQKEDIAAPDFTPEYKFDKIDATALDAMSYNESTHIVSKSADSLTIDGGKHSFVHKSIKNLENGTYCVSVDLEAAEDITKFELKANPTDNVSGEKKSALISGASTHTRRLWIKGVSVTNGSLYIRFDYSTAAGVTITVKNLRIMRVGAPNYLTVNYGGVVLYPEKVFATVGESVGVTVKANISPAGQNYRFIGWEKDGERIGNELTYTAESVGNSPAVTAVYYHMPDGAELYDANDDSNVDIRDLIRVKRYLANSATKITVSAADIDGNYAVETDDMIKIKKHLLGVF